MVGLQYRDLRVLILFVPVGIQVYKRTSAAVFYRLRDDYKIISMFGASTLANVSGSITNAFFIKVSNIETF